jgi:hypothetical protein
LRLTQFRRRTPPAAFTLRRPHPALIGTSDNASSFPLSVASRTVPKFRWNPAFPRAGTGAGAGSSQNRQIPACGSGNPAFFPRDIFTLFSLHPPNPMTRAYTVSIAHIALHIRTHSIQGFQAGHIRAIFELPHHLSIQVTNEKLAYLECFQPSQQALLNHCRST